MTVTITGHFDGKAIYPDQPLDLPVNEPLEIRLEIVTPQGPAGPDDAWEESLGRILARGVRGSNIPLETLSREAIYEGHE